MDLWIRDSNSKYQISKFQIIHKTEDIFTIKWLLFCLLCIIFTLNYLHDREELIFKQHNGTATNINIAHKSR